MINIFSYDPDVLLGDLLQGQIEEYTAGFRYHWALDAEAPPEDLDPGTWKTAKLFDQLAALWVKTARSLQAPNLSVDLRETLAKLRDIFGEDLRKNDFIHQRVQIELVPSMGDGLYESTVRALDLLELLAPLQAERTQAYLYRVANCYIRGFETEGVVMCRAVLDAALQEYVDDREVVEAGNSKRPQVRYVDLDDRLRHLRRTGKVDKEGAEAADSVRQAGNHAVHVAPGMTQLRESIVQLISVLRQLENTEA